MICFACPICNKVLSVADSQKGAKLPCPRCGQRLQVPAQPRDKTVLGRPVSQAAAAQRAGAGAALAEQTPVSVPEPPPAPPQGLWYYSHAGLRFGPISWATLLERVATRHVEPADLVWTPGMTYWSAAQNVPGLLPNTPGEPPAAPAVPPASVVPPPLPAPARPAVPRQARSSVPLWKRILREAKAVLLATLTFPLLLLLWPAHLVAGFFRRRSLRRSALEAQAVLGQRLHQLKVGDEQLRGQVDTLNERLLSLEATLGKTRAAKAERRGLLLRLAAPVLAQERAPAGAESEHARARAAQAALLSYQEGRAARAFRLPWRGLFWRRVALGWAVLGCLALLFVFWDDLGFANFGGPSGRQADAKRFSDAQDQRVDADGSLAREKKSILDKQKKPAGAGKKWTSRKTKQDSRRETRPAPKEKTREKETRPAEKEKPAKKETRPVPKKEPRVKPPSLEARVALVRGDRGQASGFLVGPDLLATTYTVVKDTKPNHLEIYFPSADGADMKPLPYTVLSTDSRHNLAFLLVKTNLPPLPLAERHQFDRGEEVRVISNPDQGKGDLEENVSLTGTWRARMLLRRRGLFEWLRLASKPACLGGPVLDPAGKVIGMITYREPDFPEVVYSIPLSDLHKAVRLAQARD